MNDMKQFVVERYNEAEKTTHINYGNTIIHSVKLKNGYVIVEHCICRDPIDFNIEEGLNLCKEKVLILLLEIYEPVENKSNRR